MISQYVTGIVAPVNSIIYKTIPFVVFVIILILLFKVAFFFRNNLISRKAQNVEFCDLITTWGHENEIKENIKLFKSKKGG